MPDAYISLIDIGLGFLNAFAGSLTKHKAPQNVIDAVTATVDAVEAHKNDLVTKANLEAQRG